MDRGSGNEERLGWRSRRRIVAAVTAVAVIVPVSMTLASDVFSDVPDTHPFHDAITTIANAGITSGCGSGKYCPGSNVTRGQMAVFLNRIGALGFDEIPVTNAFMLNGEIPLNFNETFTLVGGGPASECATVDLAVLFDFWFDVPDVEIPFEAYTIFYQLVDAPVATSLVNIQLEDDPSAPDDNVFDVCFQTVDDSPLLAGDYVTYYLWNLFIGGNIFGPASSQGSSSVGDRLVPRQKTP